MAVYTEVSDDELAQFLAAYEVGQLYSMKGIAEGVENSNFLLHAAAGSFILTLYEKRVAEADLPFFIALMEHLAGKGLDCPQPVKTREGGALGRLAGRPAAMVTFLEGLSVRRPRQTHCAAAGAALADLHAYGADFAMMRPNALSLDSWGPLFARARDGAERVMPGLTALVDAELAHLDACWPRDLPAGVIHADLFPDNILFLGERAGLIDFYFACTDFYAYDLAICLNAWCFRAGRLVQHHQRGQHDRRVSRESRAVGGRDRRAADAGARRRVALCADAPRRLAERAARRSGAAEGSGRVHRQAALPPACRRAERAGCRRVSEDQGDDGKRVAIWTDGACSGNPGPGGWGAILKFGGSMKELSGGEALTTNNRMELLAAIEALGALKRGCAVDVYTDSAYVRGGITGWLKGWKRNGWKTADKKPVKNVELWQLLDEAAQRHEVAWHWVKGHAGDPMNERADELAREGMRPYKPGR